MRIVRTVSQVIVGLMLTAGLLAGCVSMPQNAQEYRKSVPATFNTEKDSYEVDRSLVAISRTFKEMAHKCLNVRLKVVGRGMKITRYYKPTVRVAANRAEFHLQELSDPKPALMKDVPEDGYYVFVADAVPISNHKTRIDIYRFSTMGVVNSAVKSWATGENVGCPDLSRQTSN